MSPFAELLERLPLPASAATTRAQATLDAVIYRIIDERRASGRTTAATCSRCCCGARRRRTTAAG